MADPKRVRAAKKAWRKMRSKSWIRHHAAVKAWRTRKANGN